MNKPKYKKTESSLIRGLCSKCRVKYQRSVGKNKAGKTRYASICSSCHEKLNPVNRKPRPHGPWNTTPYQAHKKDKCGFCGFVPVNQCQLDVDHIDGNHKNNSVENLQTLCANCHRLKTFLHKEGIYSNRR